MINGALLDKIKTRLDERHQIKEADNFVQALTAMTEKKISSKLDKDKTISFVPTSSREVRRNPVSKMFSDGTTRIWNGPMLAKNNEKVDNNTRVVQVPSSAIAHIRYEPKTGLLYQSFKSNPKKEYVYQMTKEEFLRYINSGSKGRYTSKVLKYENRAPKKYWI